MSYTEEGTLVVPLATLRRLREGAEGMGLGLVVEVIDRITERGITVNLPARQLAAIAETLRPIVETDWQAKEQADFTPSGVNG
jgi:hypothetical protein